MATERVPPHAAEAEVAVLGGCLIDSGHALPIVIETLDADAFYREAHRRMYRAMLRIFERGDTVDPITVPEELNRTQELDGVGGMEYMAALLDAVPTAANVEYHARIVADRWRLRRMIEVSSETIRDCYDPGERSTDDLLDEAQRRVMEVSVADGGKGMVRAATGIKPLFAMIESGGVKGTPTGLVDLDRMLTGGGFLPRQLVVVAGATSMGKTSLGLSIALNVALNARKRVALCSIEMGTEENLLRMMAMEAQVPLKDLIEGGTQFGPVEWENLAKASGLIHHAPFWLDDQANTTAKIRARARKLKAGEGLDLLVIDHIHDMEDGASDRRIQLGNIARGLKALAKELDCTVVALAQLKRLTERVNPRPSTNDLKESGDIENSADTILLLHRPEYYFGPNKDGEDIRGKAELIVGKQRNGATGTVPLYFRDYCARFESLSR